jgi:hypothetical protein
MENRVLPQVVVPAARIWSPLMRAVRTFVWSPSIRAVRTFVTVVAVLFAVFNVWWIGCGMLAGWIPLQFGQSSDAYVLATVLPQITQLEVNSGLACSGAVCHQLTTPMAVTMVPVWIRAVSALAVLMEVVGVLIALVAARRTLALVAAGAPFDDAVPRALRLAALGLVGGTLLRSVLTWPAFLAVVNWVDQLNNDPVRVAQHLGVSVSTNPLYLNLPLLTMGLIVGCLVVAFREGARLEKDAEGVV